MNNKWKGVYWYMITTNKLPLMKRSRLRVVVNHDLKDKKHGSLLILNNMNTKNLKNKLIKKEVKKEKPKIDEAIVKRGNLIIYLLWLIVKEESK